MCDVVGIAKPGAFEKRLEPRTIDAHGDLAGQESHVLDKLRQIARLGTDFPGGHEIAVERQRVEGCGVRQRPARFGLVDDLGAERPKKR